MWLGVIRWKAGLPLKPQRKTRRVAPEILAGLREFAETLERKEPIAGRFNCRVVELDLRPTAYDPKRVKKTRQLLHVSQKVFAILLGVSVKTVSAWEQGITTPGTMARRFMEEIRASPTYWANRLRAVAVAR